MEKPGFQEAQRKQVSLLGPLEKKTLIWLAEHAPPWVTSDQLTLLGFAAMLLAGLSYWWARWETRALLLVIVWLAVNWLGDSLDGTLARVRNRQRPRYGFYVDHVVDMFSSLFLLGGLALSGYISPWVAAGLLIGFYMLSIELYLATYTLGTFQLSQFKFGPTELRILLSIGNLFVYFRPEVNFFGRRYLFFDVGGVIGIAGMLFIVLYATVVHTRALYNAERLS